MNEVHAIQARLCALGLLRCVGIDADGEPQYEVTPQGLAVIGAAA